MSVFSRLVTTSLPLVPKFVVGKVAARYVAGTTRAEALATVRGLNQSGAMATLDLLGEEVRVADKATAAVDEYIRLLEEIASLGLDSNVSIKPTMLGLSISEALCRDNIERIVSAAHRLGNFVRIDMEDASTTDATLRMYRELFDRYGNVGVVLQAYMRRTLADIEALPEQNANIRICKGIYIEPRRVAWKGFDTVRLAYLAALEKLFRQNVYAAIATHDEYLVAGAIGLIDRYAVPRERYEFQMLLGVEETLRSILLTAGHRLRVYVPYGIDWYPYSLRRLRENPEIARHVMRAMLSPERG
jgi:proline dehydrogenase